MHQELNCLAEKAENVMFIERVQLFPICQAVALDIPSAFSRNWLPPHECMKLPYAESLAILGPCCLLNLVVALQSLELGSFTSTSTF